MLCRDPNVILLHAVQIFKCHFIACCANIQMSFSCCVEIQIERLANFGFKCLSSALPEF